MIGEILSDHVPTIVCLVPKASHYDWNAREDAIAAGSTIQTVKELYTSLGHPDPRPFLDKNVSYARESLRAHSQLNRVGMICESSMRLERARDLQPLIVAVEYEYEFSEEALVRACKRHPNADAILNSNPNGRPTEAAMKFAKQAGVGLFSLRELMGAVNYDGEKFRSYRRSD